MGDNDQQDDESTDYELGVALVSILFSISLSIGFGVYPYVGRWWVAVLLALVSTALLAGLIRLGGADGVIPKIGRWVLGR